MIEREYCRSKKKISTTVLIIALLASLFMSSFMQPNVSSSQPPIDTSAYYLERLSQPRNVDPTIAYDASSRELIQNVYEPLIFFSDHKYLPPETSKVNGTDLDSLDSFSPVLATAMPTVVQNTYANGSVRPGSNWTFTTNTAIYYQDWTDENGTLHHHQTVTVDDVLYSFQRMLVQDIPCSPSWMIAMLETGYMYFDAFDADPATKTIEPVGVDGVGERAIRDLIQNAMSTSGNSITFCFTADRPLTDVYQIFAQTWSCIAPEDFCISHGCWDGIFADGWSKFRRYPNTSATPLDRHTAYSKYASNTAEPAMVGTGPYRFTFWDQAAKVWRIDKFADYHGGWAGNHVNTVIARCVNVWPTAKMLFLQGEFDECEVPRAYMYDLLDSASPAPAYTPITGIILYYDIPTISNDAMAFCYNVSSNSSYMSYVNGVAQPYFFNDLHVRKAFAYSINFTSYLLTAWFNEAIHPASWWVQGCGPDFENKNLEPYNLNKALVQSELTAAGLWNSGFITTLVYETGNAKQRIACEMVAQTFASLGSKFRCNVVSVDSQTYSSDKWAMSMPVFFVTKSADFIWPDSFARPYMHSQGEIAYFHPYGNSTMNALVDSAATDTMPSVNATYQTLQTVYWNNVPDLPLVQPLQRIWIRNWVRNVEVNQLYPGIYFYLRYKTAPGALKNIDVRLETITCMNPPSYPIYLFNGQMRVGNGNTSLLNLVYRVTVARTDVIPGMLFAVVGLKVTNQSNMYYFYANVTYVVLPPAPGMSVVVEMTWSALAQPITAGYWNVSAEVYPINFDVIDTDWANNRMTDGSWRAVSCKTDFNGDGKVDAFDWIAFSGALGRTGPPGWIPEDLMPDGVIDDFDQFILARRAVWSSAYPDQPPTIIPEIWPLKVQAYHANFLVPVYSDYIVYSNTWSFNTVSRQFSFDVTTEIDAFCDVTIPATLMSGSFSLYLDGVPAPCGVSTNVTHYFIHFSSTGLRHRVTIESTMAGLLGDANGDGWVDIYDAILLANAYNSVPGSPSWNAAADLNRDNIVDIYDAIILAGNYNQHY